MHDLQKSYIKFLAQIVMLSSYIKDIFTQN